MKDLIKSGEQQIETQVMGTSAPAEALVHVSITITWDGNRPATLTKVRDNSRRLPIVPTVGTGAIVLSYDDAGGGWIEPGH